MDNIIEIMTNFYKTKDTKDLAKVFETYMKSIGARKLDHRRKDNTHTYAIEGDCTNWNRCECYYFKEDGRDYRNAYFGTTLRKRAGSYFLIEYKGKRPFEVSYDGILHYDEEMMKDIVEEFSGLFELLTVE